MKCYVHQQRGKIISFPDPDRMEIQDEYWQDEMAEIEANSEDYLQIEPMSSRRSFQIMEDFAQILTDEKYKIRLLNILDRAKPFGHFKFEIEGSAYREQWFAFRNQEMLSWVREQL